MPAAAVIPAPIVYHKFAAVEKLVVGNGREILCGMAIVISYNFLLVDSKQLLSLITLRKLERSKQA